MNTLPKARPSADFAQNPALFQIMRLLEEKPHASQRELARMLGVSVGKANFCLRALIDKGLVKAENYRKADNKLAYLYLLTPTGIVQKAQLTRQFLERKVREYELLRVEIDRLTEESAVARRPTVAEPSDTWTDERADAT